MDDLCRALDDLQHVRIDGDDLQRWAATARQLEHVTPAILAELVDLHRDPCTHRLHRCANAAKYAATISDEPMKTVAIKLAESFEQAAG
ncbi:hypothetical protein RLW55_16875 [Hyphomicrobium sp. B1]|uniref:hypothetical protein n=1 Tax=Hyphomicrobium sp. B1 TaxID=3075651 RepID=UPI003C2D31A3